MDRGYDGLQTEFTAGDGPGAVPLAAAVASAAHELAVDGFTILPQLFDAAIIDRARTVILENRHLFKRTRPTASSGHLAGFHRFPVFEPLHGLLTGHPAIAELIGHALPGEAVCSIGLSDITINRSQPWHVDLLRGKYRRYLEEGTVWGNDGGGVYKILLYLNASSSLKVARGSHLTPISLASDRYAEPCGDVAVCPVAVRSGDVVVMDLRCSHRGADEAAYAAGQCDDNPRMLVSTVVGGVGRKLARAMEIGNFQRYLDWQDRNA